MINNGLAARSLKAASPFSFYNISYTLADILYKSAKNYEPMPCFCTGFFVSLHHQIDYCMAKNLLNKYVWLVETIYKAKKISFDEINHHFTSASYLRLTTGNPVNG